MYRTAFATLAALILLPGTTHGQLLQFDQDGGVRVNAPFVDVQVGPAGETYVRAPFTSRLRSRPSLHRAPDVWSSALRSDVPNRCTVPSSGVPTSHCRK